MPHPMKTLAIAGAALGLVLAAGAASAQERAINTGLGAVAGAIVAGPIGAVAGGAIGYGAGRDISRGLGLSGRKSYRKKRSAQRRTSERRVAR
jgi:membrane protein DedA with SNARE-associated domain